MVTASNEPETFFELVDNTPYMINTTRVMHLEDVAGEFFTSEEMQEILGFDTPQPPYCYSGLRIKQAAVIQALTNIQQTLISENKKSMIVKDTDLITALTEASLSASKFVPGLRRIGNRFTLYNKSSSDKIKINKKQAAKLVKWALRQINSSSKITVTITGAMDDLPSALRVCQQLVKWEDISFTHAYYASPTPQEIESYKLVWDDPTVFESATKTT